MLIFFAWCINVFYCIPIFQWWVISPSFSKCIILLVDVGFDDSMSTLIIPNSVLTLHTTCECCLCLPQFQLGVLPQIHPPWKRPTSTIALFTTFCCFRWPWTVFCIAQWLSYHVPLMSSLLYVSALAWQYVPEVRLSTNVWSQILAFVPTVYWMYFCPFKYFITIIICIVYNYFSI